MRIPIKWLKQYIELKEPVSDIVSKLLAAGIEVEEVWRPADAIENVVVGQIKRVRRHSNADRLLVCDVDVSQAPVTALPNPLKGVIQIVTGAANIIEGQSEGSKIPVAIDGAKVAGGKIIKASALRGEKSDGMLCSLTELGLETASSGIAILNGDLLIGQNIMVALGFDEPILEINVLPNRPDCMSLLGIARELSAIYGRPLKLEDAAQLIRPENQPNPIKVEVLDHEACPRYMGRYISGVQVGPSPAWMQTQLRLMGLKPVSNVVDITNYVLFELGQPLHAFDAAALLGEKISVRRAKAGEVIDALDGQDYKLSANDLVIADEQGPVALAGIIGGRRSSTLPTTKNIFLEAACFKSSVVRASARATGLSSDSSTRFERSVDIESMGRAMDRACSLLQDLARGVVFKPIVDLRFHQASKASLKLRYPRLQHMLGCPLPKANVSQILTSLGFQVLSSDAESIDVSVPSHRSFDITREADLIEEVARMHGYEQIPASLPALAITARPLPVSERLRRRLSQALVYFGFHETLHFSMVSARENQACHLGKPYPALSNPLNPEMEELRTGLLAGLLRTLRHHIGQQIWDLSLFEVGKVFTAEEGEAWHLAGLCAGKRQPLNWQDVGAWDLSSLKGLLGELAQTVMHERMDVRLPVQDPRFHGGQSFYLFVGTQQVGIAGKLSLVFTEQMGLPADLYYFEIDLKALPLPERAKFKTFASLPAIRRDVTMTVEKQTHAAIIYNVQQAAGDLLETVFLKDSFESEKIGAGKKNLTYELVYRHAERTLTDDEVNERHAKVKASLREHLHVLTV